MSISVINAKCLLLKHLPSYPLILRLWPVGDRITYWYTSSLWCVWAYHTTWTIVKQAGVFFLEMPFLKDGMWSIYQLVSIIRIKKCRVIWHSNFHHMMHAHEVYFIKHSHAKLLFWRHILCCFADIGSSNSVAIWIINLLLIFVTYRLRAVYKVIQISHCFKAGPETVT